MSKDRSGKISKPPPFRLLVIRIEVDPRTPGESLDLVIPKCPSEVAKEVGKWPTWMGNRREDSKDESKPGVLRARAANLSMRRL